MNSTILCILCWVTTVLLMAYDFKFVKNLWATAAICCLGVSLVILADKTLQREHMERLDRITESHLNPVVTPWVDEKYGCEYLVSDKGGITPRIGSECRELVGPLDRADVLLDHDSGFPGTVYTDKVVE